MSDSSTHSQRWRVGTMSFSYDDWRGVFYPASSKPSDYLRLYAQHFDTIELDSTFYATPAPHVIERWASVVPDSFRFTAKAPKAITHESDFTDVAEPMRRFVSELRRLRKKLAVILLQFPPTLPARAWPQLERFLGTLPAGCRYAVEFRHASWEQDRVYAGLERLGIALVNAEYDRPPHPPIVTADFAYVRLIGVHHRYEPTDHERIDPTAQLVWWHNAMRASRARVILCLISNDYAGFSIATADRLRTLLGQRISTTQERLGTLF